MSSAPVAPRASVLGAQQPRISSFPDYVSSAGQEAIELAALAGLVLDDWQRFVLINSLGERVDGKWAAPTVGLVVGRQNGKNAILEARELAGLFLFDEEVIIHSAHEQATSSEHFRRLLNRIESVPEFESRVMKAPRGKGAEAIELRGGQRVLFKTRTGGGGRGFTGDLIVYDEAMILSASAKAALVPTLAAKSIDGNIQTWYAGSAVDQQNPKHDGLELSRVRERGLAEHPSVAYFEWSAPGDDPSKLTPEQAADPEMIRQANPGLGIRISLEWVDHEREVELGAREYAVERLGVGDWPSVEDGDSIIGAEAWARVAGDTAEVTGPAFAFDISPDRAWASIAVAGSRPDAFRQLEIIEHRKMGMWLLPRIIEIGRRHGGKILCDARGPAGALLPELEQAGIVVEAISTAELVQACGMLFDGVDQQTVRHLNDPVLNAAIAGATRRKLGDAWAWSRKDSSVDISPLVAVTLALFGLASGVAEPWTSSW